jgi:uncharacterized protein DUF4326
VSAPTRVQLRRTKGYRKPEDAIVVARPSRWGNPFTVAACIAAALADDKALAREVCVGAFRDWLNGDTWAAGSGPDWNQRRLDFIASLADLRGKDLACWCKPSDACHADVLLELANA